MKSSAIADILTCEEAILRLIEQRHIDTEEGPQKDDTGTLPFPEWIMESCLETIAQVYPSKKEDVFMDAFGERINLREAKRWLCEPVVPPQDDEYPEDVSVPKSSTKRQSAIELPPPKRLKFSSEGSDDISPYHENFLELLGVEFEQRDTSSDPTGRLFWKDVRKRFPHINTVGAANKLRALRFEKRRKEKSLVKNKLSIPKKILAAMEGLVTEFPNWGNERRLDEVESIYNAFLDSKPPVRATKAFWNALRGLLSDEAVNEFPAKLKARRQTKKRSDMSAMGMNRNGIVKENFRIRSASSPVMSKSEARDQGDFLKTLPFLTTGNFSTHIDTLKDLNQELAEELLQTKTGKTINKAHKGVSLGKTVVSGGTYGNKAKGISGSIHWNKALMKKGSLQRKVFLMVKNVVREAFGKKKWFKDWMRFFRKQRPDLKQYLIPGLPCTSIWWSYDDRPFNLHHDWNSYGAAFLFCPEERAGGEIVILNPDGDLDLAASIHMTEGKVLCGRWARSPHCNLPLLEDKKRFSFVAYFDSRIETGNYLSCFENHPTEAVAKATKTAKLAEPTQVVIGTRKKASKPSSTNVGVLSANSIRQQVQQVEQRAQPRAQPMVRRRAAPRVRRGRGGCRR